MFNNLENKVKDQIKNLSGLYSNNTNEITNKKYIEKSIANIIKAIDENVCENKF